MKNQNQKLVCRWSWFLTGLVVLVGFSGCVSHRAALKDTEGGAPALRAFREGAQLLFVDNEAARAKFVEAIAIEPTMFEAHFNAAVASEAVGQDPEAVKFYQSCLAQKKDQPACLGNLLLVLVRLGEGVAANTLAQHYLAEFPEEPFAMVAAAKLAFAQDNLVDAEKYAREAIERDAENTEALEIMSRVFFAQKKYAAAKWVAKNALEHAPGHGGIHLLLGHAFVKLGLMHDALDSYAAAAKFLPTEEALESYGLLLMKRGRVNEALPVLQRLAELRPLDYRNQLHLGNAYMANKQFDEAKAAYQKALELAPNQKDINFNLGLLYFDFKPEGLPEFDRMKIALGYFQAYLDQSGLSKERLDEVNRYVTSLKDKISYAEEVARESAAAKEEEALEPKAEEKPEEPKPEEEQPKAEEPTPEPVQEEAPLKEPEASPPPPKEEEQAKPKEEEKPRETPKEEPLFDEEPEDEKLEEEKPVAPVKKGKAKKEEIAKPPVKKKSRDEEDDEELFDEGEDLEDF